MTKRTAIIAGATGLAGSYLLEFLLESEEYHRIIAFTRKPLEDHPKLECIITDFDNLDQFQDNLTANDVFCCLGTTMKKAGSKDKFRKVDLDYVVRLADLTSSNGSRQFLLVSSLGANSKSRIFYNRVKGEAEQQVSKFEFETIHFLRPSLLLGKRKESRTGEKVGKWLSFVFWPFFVTLFKKYKPIHAQKVAKAMYILAIKDEKGIFYHESDQISRLASNNNEH